MLPMSAWLRAESERERVPARAAAAAAAEQFARRTASRNSNAVRENSRFTNGACQCLPGFEPSTERERVPARAAGTAQAAAAAAAASVREDVSRRHESVRPVHAVPQRQAATADATAELSAQQAERHIPELLSATDAIQKRAVRSRQVPAGHGRHAAELRLPAGHQVPERPLPGARGSGAEARAASAAAATQVRPRV